MDSSTPVWLEAQNDLEIQESLRWPRWRERYGWRLKLAVGAVAMVGLAASFYQYQHLPLRLDYRSLGAPVDQPIRVAFNQEISPQLNYSLTPGLAGTWKRQYGIMGVTGLMFYPDHKLEAGHVYRLNIAGVKKAVLGTALPDQSLTVLTEKPPAVASFYPDNGASRLTITPEFKLVLGAPNHQLRHLAMRLEPAVELDAALLPDDTTFTWKPKTTLAQSTDYRVVVEDLNINDPAKRVIVDRRFRTVDEPQVTSATQTDHLYPGDKLTIKFADPMEAGDWLKFDMPGSGRWADAQTYEFVPGQLAPGTAYKYRLLKGARSQYGGVKQADQEFSVSTPGAVFVTGASPGGSGISRGAATRISFDQPVDHTSAQAHFSLSPNVGGSFSWAGNTMVYQSAGLDYQTTYTFGVAAGVGSVYGLTGNRAFSQSFTTEIQTIKLPVPAYRQQYAASCEASALRMVLAYRGINQGDLDIVGRFGYAPRPRDTASNSWDNPNQMFVGDINGVQNTTGYGVHAGPVAAAARSYGRGASANFGVSASFIAGQIHAGNPVIVWGFFALPSPDSWNTSSGVVNTWKGEHTRLVVGVAGSASNPVGFYVNDPATGAGFQYWSAGALLANMNVYGFSNMAVPVN